MRVLLVLFLLMAGDALALDFTRYHSQAEISAYLREIAVAHPDLVTFEKLGSSEQGRELSYVVVTKSGGVAPAIYLNGTHHGNEKSSTESVLAFVDELVTKQNDATISDLLERYVFVVQPMVNADGHAANTREDAKGRDPNRDYSYPGKDENDAFKTPAIQLVKTLLEKFAPHAAIAYHSGMEAVLWPWCATGTPTPLKDIFYTLSKTAAVAMGFKNYKQSYFDYPSHGEFVDYAFQRYGTFGVTFEVSSAGNPPASQLPAVVKRAVKGTLAFVQAVAAMDGGRLAIAKAPFARQQFNRDFVRLGRKVE